MEVIKKLKALGKGIFVITHDLELIVRCADYILHIEEGCAEKFCRMDDAGRKIPEAFFSGMSRKYGVMRVFFIH